MGQSLPLCRSPVASGFELPSCDADGHWQARMTPARLVRAIRSSSRSHTSVGSLPERMVTCRLLLFRRHRADTYQHRKHREADSTGPESPTAGPTSVPPESGHGTPDPHPHPHPRFAGDRGSSPSPVPIGGSVPCAGLSRSTGTPASPGKPPGGSWAARQPPKGRYRNWGC
jgi:hypothetical protein